MKGSEFVNGLLVLFIIFLLVQCVSKYNAKVVEGNCIYPAVIDNSPYDLSVYGSSGEIVGQWENTRPGSYGFRCSVGSGANLNTSRISCGDNSGALIDAYDTYTTLGENGDYNIFDTWLDTDYTLKDCNCADGGGSGNFERQDRGAVRDPSTGECVFAEDCQLLATYGVVDDSGDYTCPSDNTSVTHGDSISVRCGVNGTTSYTCNNGILRDDNNNDPIEECHCFLPDPNSNSINPNPSCGRLLNDTIYTVSCNGDANQIRCDNGEISNVEGTAVDSIVETGNQITTFQVCMPVLPGLSETQTDELEEGDDDEQAGNVDQGGEGSDDLTGDQDDDTPVLEEPQPTNQDPVFGDPRPPTYQLSGPDVPGYGSDSVGCFDDTNDRTYCVLPRPEVLNCSNSRLYVDSCSGFAYNQSTGAMANDVTVNDYVNYIRNPEGSEINVGNPKDILFYLDSNDCRIEFSDYGVLNEQDTSAMGFDAGCYEAGGH